MALVIAECCQNHLGDWAILKDMVWAAAEVGADIVKVQSMLAADLVRRERFEEGVVRDGRTLVLCRPFEPGARACRGELDAALALVDGMRQAELSDELHHRFVEECGKAGVEPLTTVFSQSRIPFLASLPWRRIKVASYDCASVPMLRTLAERFDHLFISTGATYDSEVADAARALTGRSFTFLHCVTIYPTPLDALDLARMEWLRQFTPSVGFSDHTLVARDGLKASLAALWLGADVIERHFTLLPPEQTKDGPVSIGPESLGALVRYARAARGDLEAAVREQVGELQPLVGRAQRALSPEEELNRDYYRGRFASLQGGRVIYNWEPLGSDDAAE